MMYFAVSNSLPNASNHSFFFFNLVLKFVNSQKKKMKSLPALVRLPSPGRIKAGRVILNRRRRKRAPPPMNGHQRKIVDRSGRRIGQRDIGVVNLDEVSAVVLRSIHRRIGMVDLSQTPVSRLDLPRGRVPADS